DGLNGGGQVVRVEAEWSGLAFVQNASAWRDQVESIGPARVHSLHAVIKTVDQRGKLDAQFAHACSRHGCAFRFVTRAAKQDALAYVRPHLPHVCRMRLEDVDRVEGDLVLILLGQLVQGGNL